MKILMIIAGVLFGLILIISVIGYFLPVSHIAKSTAELHSNPLQVWQTVTNVKEYSHWRKNVKKVEILGQNAWREMDTHGKMIEYNMEVQEIGTKLKTKIVSKGLPFGGYWDFRFNNKDDTTEVTITEFGEVYNPIFRFVSRFIMGHTATINSYLSDLKAKLE
jgi:uncharacterized protein (DUF58 family)